MFESLTCAFVLCAFLDEMSLMEDAIQAESYSQHWTMVSMHHTEQFV